MKIGLVEANNHGGGVHAVRCLPESVSIFTGRGMAWERVDIDRQIAARVADGWPTSLATEYTKAQSNGGLSEDEVCDLECRRVRYQKGETGGYAMLDAADLPPELQFGHPKRNLVRWDNDQANRVSVLTS